MNMSKPERLQKVMAQAGVASRRECEKLIRDGRVTVDGKTVTKLGSKVTPGESVVKVDGKRLRQKEKVYFLLNKPRGVISSTKSKTERRCVTDFVPKQFRDIVHPVGRLDVNTTGLILLSNDGELTQLIEHPRNEIKKTYLAKVKGFLSAQSIEKMKQGVNLDDGKAKVDEVRVVERTQKATTLELTLHEGRKHIVRRILFQIGFPVKKLHRLAIGSITTGALGSGELRQLTEKELKAIMLCRKGPQIQYKTVSRKSVSDVLPSISFG